jgi:hypothetical protein
LICRRPPSALTPGNIAAARARCFTADNRLHRFWAVGPSLVELTRPNPIHAFALRLTSSPSQAPAKRSPPRLLGRLHVERAISHGQLLSANKINQASPGAPEKWRQKNFSVNNFSVNPSKADFALGSKTCVALPRFLVVAKGRVMLSMASVLRIFVRFPDWHWAFLFRCRREQRRGYRARRRYNRISTTVTVLPAGATRPETLRAPNAALTTPSPPHAASACHALCSALRTPRLPSADLCAFAPWREPFPSARLRVPATSVAEHRR